MKKEDGARLLEQGDVEEISKGRYERVWWRRVERNRTETSCGGTERLSPARADRRRNYRRRNQGAAEIGRLSTPIPPPKAHLSLAHQPAAHSLSVPLPQSVASRPSSASSTRRPLQANCPFSLLLLLLLPTRTHISMSGRLLVGVFVCTILHPLYAHSAKLH